MPSSDITSVTSMRRLSTMLRQLPGSGVTPSTGLPQMASTAAGAAQKPWRLSSSVVILVPSSGVPGNKYTEEYRQMNLPSFDYRVCCVRRAAKSSFMPDAIVFPGGAVEAEDKKMAKDLLGSDSLEATLKCAAAREAFEESGVELFSKTLLEPLATQSTWRKRVHEDASQFRKLCDSYKTAPAADDMHFWCSFVTPDMEHDKLKRGGFDARFFVYCATQEQVKLAQVDNTETTELLWLSPAEALLAVDQGKISMVPPQWYILNELCQACPTMASVGAYASSEVRKLSREYPIKPYPVSLDKEEQLGFLERRGLTAQDAKVPIFSLCYPGDEKHPVFPGKTGARHRMLLRGTFGGQMQFELQMLQQTGEPLQEALKNWYSLAELR